MFLKQLLILVISLSSFIPCFSQNTVEDWVHKGIDLHELGQYDEAIAAYKKGLKIDKKSSLAFYEMAYTYMEKGDYKKAIKYSKKVIKTNKNYLLESYLVHGSALDLIGKSEKGIQFLEKANQLYPESHLVLFNLGITYPKVNKHRQAKQALMEAIKIESKHSNSHLALAQIQLKAENMPFAALSYIYFLLLEPDSQRSAMAHHYLSTIINSPKYKIEKIGKDQLLYKDFELLFETVGKIEDESVKKTDIYANLYIPIFNTILQKELTETLEYYIGQHQGVMNTSWLNQHEEQVNQLLEILPKS